MKKNCKDIKDTQLPDLGEIKVMVYSDGSIEFYLEDMKEKCNAFLEERKNNK